MTEPQPPRPPGLLGGILEVHAEGEVIPGPDPDDNDPGEDDSGDDREPPVPF